VAINEGQLLRFCLASSHVFSFFVLERKSIDVNEDNRFMKSTDERSGFAEESETGDKRKLNQQRLLLDSRYQ
jgi:hypothetical protein